ncbi:MAG: EAL domain-containing protein [Actinomycetota bacterium]|nr:EAL domain-containing protein [Actinomycetota bacterium]
MASSEDQIGRLERRLERERRTRREAEQIAERTTAALYDRQRELELLEAVAAASNQASTLKEALRVAIERVCAHTRWPVGHAYIATPEGDLVSSKVWHMDDPVRFQRFRRVSEERTFVSGEGLPGRVAATGKPAWIVDTDDDEDFVRNRIAPENGVRGAFAFPVLVNAEVVAVIEILDDRPTDVDQSLLRVAAQLGTQLGRVVERARAREEITHQGLHDALTGLPNRVLFLDRLTGALARSSRSAGLTAVLFVDLDRFKIVNDSYGHGVGDSVLVEVASRLDAALRPGDTIARLGGDEFVILCEAIEDGSEALRVAERLQLELVRPFNAQGSEAHVVTSSIGVAIGTLDTDPEDLVHDADAAMYRAKDLGRARHELFDEAMRDRALAQLRTERALRKALAKGELQLHFQPIVSLADPSRVQGVEALVRWQHPERGLVSPAEFIPLAEETGLILPIGDWVLHQACRQAAQWRRELGPLAPLPVRVNLAARQLGQEDLPAIVKRALLEANIDPEDLGLEITESALIENAEVPARTLADLRALGVRVQLDDFGTGYSSLSYLQRFPVDGLKIDRAFVAGLGERPDASAIVSAIVAMGHALGLTIVAEGIETQVQAAEALRLGCDSGQGYLFGAPAPAAEAATAPMRSASHA